MYIKGKGSNVVNIIHCHLTLYIVIIHVKSRYLGLGFVGYLEVNVVPFKAVFNLTYDGYLEYSEIFK
jgi:hypothetical protein